MVVIFYNIATDMYMAKICPCTSKQYGLLHYKCVLICCDMSPIIVLSSQEVNKYTTNTCSKIGFYVYHIMYHVVLYMSNVHMNKAQHVQCVTKFLYLTLMPNYTHKNNLCY